MSEATVVTLLNLAYQVAVLSLIVLGLGIVHSQDMLDAARAIEQGLWDPQALDAADAPRRFGFVRVPAP